jgi:hypothetical protein
MITTPKTTLRVLAGALLVIIAPRKAARKLGMPIIKAGFESTAPLL